MSKKFLAVLTIMTLSVLLASSVAFAFGEDSALAAAKSYVPSTSSYNYVENDGYKYSFHFNDNNAGTIYEVDVNKFTDNVIEFKMESCNDQGSNVIKLNNDQVKNIIANDFSNANIYKLKLDRDGGFSKYEVSFTASGISEAKYEINPESGNVISKTIKY